MVLYTVATVGLVVFSCILFFPRFRTFVSANEQAVNFLLTIVATLVGVLLAIVISNYDANRKERLDVIKLLNASINSVETCREYSESLLNHFLSLEDGTQVVAFLEKNPLPYPGYLEVFLSQNIVSKNLSEEILSDLNEIIINLKRSAETKPMFYIEMLTRAELMMKAEVKLLQGKIDLDDLSERLDMIEERPVNILETER